MSRKNNIGHLITITNESTQESAFLFLYMEEDHFEAYKAVVRAIRSVSLPDEIEDVCRIGVEPVTDFRTIEEDYPETKGKYILVLPALSFFHVQDKTFKEGLFIGGVKNVIENHCAFFPANRLNAVATGADFFNREELLHRIGEHLERGENLLLCGPRRYGKTSLLRKVAADAGRSGFRSIMIDLERIITPEEFAARIWAEIEYPDRTESGKNEKIEEKEAALKGNWERKSGDVFTGLNAGSEKILFLLDECPYMLDSFLGIDNLVDRKEIEPKDRLRTESFIGWFKKQRHRYRENWVFVITGSIDLNTYLADTGLNKDAFPDMTEERVTFFDDDKLDAYVESLLLGQEIFIRDDIIKEIISLTTPGIPYFIQIMLNHISTLYREKPDFSIEDLRNVYHSKIIGHDGRRHFDTFARHFERYRHREPGAKALLAELSLADTEGVEIGELKRIYSLSTVGQGVSDLSVLLKYLENDFYIERIEETDRYRFASPILKDYWKLNQRRGTL